MVNKNTKKNGFTLLEILIAMMVLMIFFTAAAKILTVKPKRPHRISAHGMVECYYSGDTLRNHEMRERATVKNEVEEGSTCEFTPSGNAAFYSIIIVHPKASSDDLTGYIDVQPTISNTLTLNPNTSEIEADGERINYSNTDLYPERVPQTDLLQYLSRNFSINGNNVSNVRSIIQPAPQEYNGAIIIHW